MSPARDTSRTIDKYGFVIKNGFMPRLHALLCGALAAIVFSGCATVPREVLYPNAPTLLPGVSADMNTSGYWIGRHPVPDTVILDDAGINRLNKSIEEQNLVRNLSALPPMTGAELKKEIAGTVDWIGNSKIYRSNGKKVSRNFLDPIVSLMDCDSIPENVEPQYGFTVQQADMRVLPTQDALYDGPGDYFIDNLQASSLEPGTPLVILHQSRDRAWLYAYSDLIAGWIPAKQVALADAAAFAGRYRNPEALIVTASKAEFYEDERLTKYIGSARMGTRLVIGKPDAGMTGRTANSTGIGVAGTTASSVSVGVSGSPRGDVSGAKKILLADRDEDGRYREKTAWVETEKVSDTVLPYTARTVYRQAFRLLNAPYGWGGTFGEQDCSQFLCEIFSTVGVTLPRNTSRQARIGISVPGFAANGTDAEKSLALLSSALPAATILRLPGHIMLYLGTVDGKPYVIHSTWSYREKQGGKEITRLINRVTVSTLELGSDTKKGTHLHRITDARIVEAKDVN